MKKILFALMAVLVFSKVSAQGIPPGPVYYAQQVQNSYIPLGCSGAKCTPVPIAFYLVPAPVVPNTPTMTPTGTLTPSATPNLTLTATPSPTPTPPSGPQYVQASVAIANTTPVVMIPTVTGKTFHVVSVLVYSTTPTTANFITFSTQTTPLPGCNGNVGYVLDNTQKDWCKTNSAGELTATESVSAPCNVNVWGYWTAP